MTWKPKKQEALSASGLEMFWEKYGTWISGAVALVLAVVLVVVLVGRYFESKARKGQAELERISADDPGAEMNLKRLALEYGDTRLGPGIQLKLAQMMFRAGDYPGAEKKLGELRGDRKLSDVDRAQVNLTLAYVAQEKGDLDEARRRYKVVEDDGLYATEAKHMLEVLDRVKKEPPAEGASAGPKK